MATDTRHAETREKMYPTRIDLPLETRRDVTQLLNRQLADTFDLYSQAKQAHWNVKGTDFIQLHKLFDELAAQLGEYADMIAERVTALGVVAMGTVRMAADASTLQDFSVDVIDGPDVVAMLAERYAAYGASTRQAIDTTEEWGDMGTSDLFIEIVRGIDKHLYFLEAHLQSQTS